jgi:hypothetical protein
MNHNFLKMLTVFLRIHLTLYTETPSETLLQILQLVMQEGLRQLTAPCCSFVQTCGMLNSLYSLQLLSTFIPRKIFEEPLWNKLMCNVPINYITPSPSYCIRHSVSCVTSCVGMQHEGYLLKYTVCPGSVRTNFFFFYFAVKSKMLYIFGINIFYFKHLD